MDQGRLCVLIIEDEIKLANAIATSLAASHWQTHIAENGEEGFFLASTQAFDAMILDLNLPGRNGLEILRSLRKQGCDTPVLILTARDGVDDRVIGLDSGADDYLTKPFAFPELHARLRALCRRARIDESSTLQCADLIMDRLKRVVYRDNKPIALTAKEFDLLEFLLRHRNQIVSRELIAQGLWQTRARVVPLDNVIDVHMTRLRAKVDSPYPVALIHTVRGVGFTIKD